MRTHLILAIALVAACAGRSRLEDVPPAAGDPSERTVHSPLDTPDGPSKAANARAATPRERADPSPAPPPPASATPAPAKVTIVPPTVGPAGPPPQVNPPTQSDQAPSPSSSATPSTPSTPASATAGTAAASAPGPAQDPEAQATARATILADLDRCQRRCSRRDDLSEDDQATCRLECVNGTLPADTTFAGCARGCLRDLSPCRADCDEPQSDTCTLACTGSADTCLEECQANTSSVAP